MAHFRAGHAVATDWRAAVDACAASVGAGAGSLGFCYVTDAFAPALGAIAERLRAATGVPHWVGTVGIGVLAAGVEHFDEPALSVMVADLPDDAFRVFAVAAGGWDAFEAAHRSWCDTARPALAIVHADPRDPRLEAMIESLAARLPGGFLVGGLASSRAGFPHLADAVVEGGLSGVMIGSAVTMATRLTQGCSLLGPRHEVTACEGHVLLELDARPALEVFYEDIGAVRARDPRRIGGQIFAALPVRGSDTGDYLVRNLVGIDPNMRAVATAAHVEPGDTVMFCRRDPGTATEDLDRMLASFSGSLSGPARGGLYFSCLARGPNLFGPDSAELKRVERALGPVPLAGFFANGEISHDRLYAYTGVLALFG